MTNGQLAEWNTSGISGLYAVKLQVTRTEQTVDTAIIHVTVKQLLIFKELFSVQEANFTSRFEEIIQLKFSNS